MIKMCKNVFIVLFLLFLTTTVKAQQADTTVTTAGANEIVELGVTEIKIKVETPQVTLFSDRLEPQFDEIHLQKSFFREIVGAGERLKFDEKVADQLSYRIDIDKLLKKAR
ncbi:MAG TPA: hypothetical protein EYP36_04320 [Calditrichaeota bacterium]|nr:hypothetical protein [Calditrichota bacterium]